VIVSKYGNEGIARLLDCYPQLYDDLSFAAKYVNLKVSKGLIDESARLEYQEDLESACRLLNINGVNEEINEDEFYHTLLKSIRPILMHLFGSQSDLFNDSEEEKKILHEWIIKMGKLRGSLG
jgi:phosphoenolpyruvate carboxylase